MLVSDEAFVKCLWGTVTSREIQYRMRMTFLQGRRVLIQNGVPEAFLPLTDELEQRLKRSTITTELAYASKSGSCRAPS